MGMGMGTRLYPLPGGNEDGTKVGYLLGFEYVDEDEFFLRGWVWDSETSARPPRCHPYRRQQ